MKVSVVIPAYNEAKLLPATLAAVERSRRAFADRGWASELIVCDNNSTDATADIARAAGALVAFEPVNQISRARNGGAALATGDWILFIDADSQPTPELFAALADAISGGRALGCGSTLRMDRGDWGLRLLTSGWNALSRLNGLLAGSFIAVETSAFRELRGFSTEHFIAEELEFGRRLKALARRRRRRVIILSSAPMVTSARKGELYSKGELFSLLWRSVLRPRATFRDRAACGVWYDGRR